MNDLRDDPSKTGGGSAKVCNSRETDSLDGKIHGTSVNVTGSKKSEVTSASPGTASLVRRRRRRRESHLSFEYEDSATDVDPCRYCGGLTAVRTILRIVSSMSSSVNTSGESTTAIA